MDGFKKYPWRTTHHSGYKSTPQPSSGVCKRRIISHRNSCVSSEEEVKLRQHSVTSSISEPMNGIVHMHKDGLGHNQKVEENCKRLAEAECSSMEPSPLTGHTQKYLDHMKVRSLGLGKALLRWG